MFNLLISSAFAQDATAAMPGGLPPALMNYAPFVMIFGVFYFIVIRPQQKKIDETTKMIKALQRGDRILLNAGIYGKITKIEGDDILFVEIADGVTVKMDRTAVQGLEAKPQPVATSGTDGK